MTTQDHPIESFQELAICQPHHASCALDAHAIATVSTDIASIRTHNGVMLDQTNQDRVWEIVIHNVECGRAFRVIEKMAVALISPHMPDTSDCDAAHVQADSGELWRSYLQRVVDIYSMEHERVAALAQNSTAVWEGLRAQLVVYARRLLQQRGYYAQCAQDKAEEIAQQTCERIYLCSYPFDVPFDYWVRTILKNTLRCSLTRSQDILDRHPSMSSLDELETPDCMEAAHLVGQAREPDPYSELEVNERMSSILAALDNLSSENRRAVVVYTYIVGMSDDEIAVTMNRNKAVVQTLRHRALHQLRTLVPTE